MGSSPRMRGTQWASIPSHVKNRIIPAYAGNTLLRHASAQAARDHPRVCGEHGAMPYVQAIPRGSSPRMRGTLSHSRRIPCHTGIIPAYAGNTHCVLVLFADLWDHPRVCGEHSSRICDVRAEQGSSPRMRGTLIIGNDDNAHGGIIPAYAGNTHREHAASPGVRIIPAYAGNTRMSHAARRSSKDHPRVCGEHQTGVANTARYLGSSPRMRGTPFDVFNIRNYEGIIPAYAGNTAPASPPYAQWRDHPRVCGEHLCLFCF